MNWKITNTNIDGIGISIYSGGNSKSDSLSDKISSFLETTEEIEYQFFDISKQESGDELLVRAKIWAEKYIKRLEDIKRAAKPHQQRVRRCDYSIPGDR